MTELICHRGNVDGSHGKHENTIAALDAVVVNQLTTMEIDVRLTKDMELVVWHDHDVWLDGGRISIMNATYADIKKKHPQVCTLEEMLDAAAAKGVRLVIEMKDGIAGFRWLYKNLLLHTPPWFKDRESILGSLVGLEVAKHLQKPNSLSPLIITSYEETSVRKARKIIRKAVPPIAFTVMDLFLLDDDWEKNFIKRRFDGINLQYDPKMARNGFEIFRKIREKMGENAIFTLFTVNDPFLVVKLTQLDPQIRPDYIITDNGASVQQLLREQAKTLSIGQRGSR